MLRGRDLPGRARAARSTSSERTGLWRLGRRAADRRLPPDRDHRPHAGPARRPAPATAADDRRRRGSRRGVLRAAVRRRSGRDRGPRGVNGIATGFFRPAVWAGLPNLVDDDDLEQATSLLSTVEHAAWMVGPIAAGGLLAITGPSATYWINAGTFVVSALLVTQIPARLLQSQESVSARALARRARRPRPRRRLAPAADRARRLEHRRGGDGGGQRGRGLLRTGRARYRQLRVLDPRRFDRCRIDRRQLLRGQRDRVARDHAGLRWRACADGDRLGSRRGRAHARCRSHACGGCHSGQRDRDRLQPALRPAGRSRQDARPCAGPPDEHLLRRARARDGRRRDRSRMSQAHVRPGRSPGASTSERR